MPFLVWSLTNMSVISYAGSHSPPHGIYPCIPPGPLSLPQMWAPPLHTVTGHISGAWSEHWSSVPCCLLTDVTRLEYFCPLITTFQLLPEKISWLGFSSTCLMWQGPDLLAGHESDHSRTRLLAASDSSLLQVVHQFVRSSKHGFNFSYNLIFRLPDVQSWKCNLKSKVEQSRRILDIYHRPLHIWTYIHIHTYTHGCIHQHIYNHHPNSGIGPRTLKGLRSVDRFQSHYFISMGSEHKSRWKHKRNFLGRGMCYW